MNRWIYRLSPLILIIIWQLAGTMGWLGATPSPREVVEAMWALIRGGDPFLGETLGGHIIVSLYRIISGFTLATVTGVGIGLAMGWYPLVKAVTRPVIEMIRPIPPFAWVVLAILWFKTGNAPAVFITFLGAFFPIVINTTSGVEEVDPLLRDAAVNLGASRWDTLIKVAVPSALPAIFTGMRIGLGVAWMSLIAAEMVGVGTQGLGLMIETSKAVWRLDYAVAGMVFIGLVGYFLDYLMRLLGNYFLHWRQEGKML